MHEISPSTRVRYERTFPLLGSEGSTRRGEPRGSSPTRAPHKPEKSKLRIRIELIEQSFEDRWISKFPSLNFYGTIKIRFR